MDTKGNILKCIKAVYKKAEDCELKPSIFKELRPELSSLSKQLNISQKQAFFFSIIFSKCVAKSSIDRIELIRYLICDAVDFIEYQSDMEKLFEKGFLNNVKTRYLTQQSIMDEDFKVNSNILQAILLKKDIKFGHEIKISNAIEFVDYVFAFMKLVKDEELSFSDVLKNVKLTINKNKRIDFITTLLKYKLSVEDICIFLFYIGSYRIGDKYECIKDLSINMYGETGKSSNLMQNMAVGKHILVKKQFLRCVQSNRHDEFEFELTGESKNMMRKYQILPEFETKVCIDTFDFLYTIETLFRQKDNDIITAKELLKQVENLLQTNEDLLIVKELKKHGLKNIKHDAIYLKTLYDGSTSSETSLETVTTSVFDTEKDAVLLKNELVQESNELIKKDLLELTEASFFSSAELRLTELSQQLLIDCGMELPDKKKNKYSILPKNIKSKTLFYNNEDASQMNMLRQILNEEKFIDIQKRMGEKALSVGVVALLYGHPGTGKTESVYQFAKQTGREVIQVDISQSKSMWFGESEKQIKKIFTRYEQYSKRCKLKPILLFNEADAIISKRKDAASSNVAQTENAIQNILLEELEKFSGICIATTNLVNNIDSAFERRFLYKIELHKPNTDTLAKIWESKLSDSSCYDVNYFARQYQFSGGQIDNIVKKIEMHEILYGNIPSQPEIAEWCNMEKLQRSNYKPIGFVNK